MKKIFSRAYWDYWLLFFIIFFAVFLRVENFSSWLHFGMDQARDATLVSEAVQKGIGQLPLLGPRAGGTFVRLGPIFYYFQFLSAKIAGSVQPPVFAYPDLLFSILTLPLLFLFLRLYFQRITSILITGLYAFNFVVIQFSRFAWNPNSIPFWTILTFYSLLRLAEEKQQKKRYFWIALMAAGWAVAGQLHFVVLAAIPAVILFFLLWTGSWRLFGWKEMLLAILILLILFSPVILSDIKMKGDNIKQFIWAFKYKPQEHNFLDNLKASATLRANYYTEIILSYISRTGKASLLAGLILILAGFILSVFRFGKEKMASKRNFLILAILWAAVSFLVLIPFAYQLKPRFLFFEIFIPFIFIGLGIEWLLSGKRYKKFVTAVAVLAVLAAISLNIEATRAWFDQMENGRAHKVTGNRQVFLQYPKAITLADISEISSYAEKKWQEDPGQLYFYGNAELRNPLFYLISKDNPDIDIEYISYSVKDREGLYFAVTYSGGGFDSLPKHYRAKFDLVESQQFSKLAIHELKLKEIQPKKSEKKSLREPKNKPETEEKAKKGLKKSDRVLWEDLFQ